jgi:hypothetical protein
MDETFFHAKPSFKWRKVDSEAQLQVAQGG